MSKRLIATGGTIDKVYIPTAGTLTFAGTNISKMLEQARVKVDDLVIEELLQVDSLDMTDDDRELIARSCADANEMEIIITHGTDTMP